MNPLTRLRRWLLIPAIAWALACAAAPTSASAGVSKYKFVSGAIISFSPNTLTIRDKRGQRWTVSRDTIRDDYEPKEGQWVTIQVLRSEKPVNAPTTPSR